MLEVNNLCKKYKKFALKDINFSIEEGYVMGLIGKNGAGKTTLIKTIMNQILKTSGEVIVNGWDNVTYEKKVKDMIGFVLVDFPYLSGTTLLNNGLLLGSYYSEWNQEVFIEYLQRFKLNPEKNYAELSKGMKTKFQLAFALAHNPKLLVLDEPTAGLDPIFRREFIDILCDLIRDEKKSILFSTHITSDLDKIADYITFIDKGEIIFSDSKENIQDKYHIVKGPISSFHQISNMNYVGLKKNETYFEALILDANTLKEDDILGLNMIIPKLEDIMLFMCNDNINGGVSNNA
jgi:ABC-2 type transport system ATP-binding protein